MKARYRALIVIASFYAPGALMLMGAWLLGYSTDEARDAVAVFGGMFGVGSAVVVAAMLFVPGRDEW